MVKIKEVNAHSHAARHGVKSGDFLVSINGHEIHDVLDYRFYLAEKSVSLLLESNGHRYAASIKKGEYDDIGLAFDTPLMDKKHNCENKCIFCFIDQNPRGMRSSIYFKDDDSRLSFLHGNYITLTNLHKEDIDRIIEMHISPVNVSVHTTNPELRREMMKNKRAGDVLEYLKILADAKIKLRGQIVLCKGINDGAELDRSMNDLYELYPQLDSVSVVPAGLTGYREGLFKLEPFSPIDCEKVIEQVTQFGDMCLYDCGERVFYASDEFYVKSGTPLPPYEFWGDFAQIENGVGMLSSFIHEFEMALQTLSDDEKQISREVSIATGEAAYKMMCGIVSSASKACPNLKIRLYKIKNNFFGGQVTVTGLLTGEDITAQLAGQSLGEELLLSRNVLRSEGDLFLCGMTPDELRDKLHVPVRFVENDGGELLFALLKIEL